MADVDPYHGYLSILSRGGRLPGLRAQGFEPAALDDSLTAIIRDPAFHDGETPAAVDTYDRMRAFQVVARDPSLRAELNNEVLLADLLGTGMSREHQAVLRDTPLHDESKLAGDDIPTIATDGLDLEEAKAWREEVGAASLADISTSMDQFSAFLGKLDGHGAWPPSEEITSLTTSLISHSNFHSCNILAVASTVICQDDPVFVDSGPPATRISTSFLTKNTEPDQFVFVSDPRNWPKCDKFFKSMAEAGLLRDQLWNPPKDFKGQEGYFLETVDFAVPGINLEMNTYLRTVTFARPQVQQGRDTVGMTYRFAGSADGQIDVDHGFLLAQRDAGIDGGLTRVSSQKTVRFRKLTNLMAGFACELGWVKQMRRMGCCAP